MQNACSTLFKDFIRNLLVFESTKSILISLETFFVGAISFLWRFAQKCEDALFKDKMKRSRIRVMWRDERWWVFVLYNFDKKQRITNTIEPQIWKELLQCALRYDEITLKSNTRCWILLRTMLAIACTLFCSMYFDVSIFDQTAQHSSYYIFINEQITIKRQSCLINSNTSFYQIYAKPTNQFLYNKHFDRKG